MSKAIVIIICHDNRVKPDPKEGIRRNGEMEIDFLVDYY